MDVKITKKDVVWGYTAQFFNYGASIILLPVILRTLPSDMLGIWYIFTTMSGFMLMLDFGFFSTFARNVAYIFNGAQKLQAKGIGDQGGQLDGPNYPLLKNAIHTIQKFYGMVSIVALFLALTAGSWYVSMKSDHMEAHAEILLAWYIYIIAAILNFFYSYYTALLTGRGLVRENNILLIVSRAVYILLAAVGILYGYGLIAIASAYMLSIIVNRILAVHFFYKKGLKQILRKTIASKEKLLPILWFNARKVGLVNLGSFFIQRGSLFFASMFLSLETFAQYGLTVNVVGILATISPLYLNTHQPELFKDRLHKNTNNIKRIFGESILIFILFYFIGAIVLLAGGTFVLELFHSKTMFIPSIPLLLLLIVQFLELNHGMACTVITTGNEVPFLKPALISGSLIAVLSLLSLAYTPLGVTGIILATGFVQLSYNNWKWPVMVCKELDTNYIKLIKVGFISLRAWFFRHCKASFLR